MTAYAVAAGKVAVHDKALVAATADTVFFADDPAYVEVVTDGTAAIYVTVDASAPTVSGDNTYKVPAVAGRYPIRHWRPGGVVKLISSGTPTYSVQSASS